MCIVNLSIHLSLEDEKKSRHREISYVQMLLPCSFLSWTCSSPPSPPPSFPFCLPFSCRKLYYTRWSTFWLLLWMYRLDKHTINHHFISSSRWGTSLVVYLRWMMLLPMLLPLHHLYYSLLFLLQRQQQQQLDVQMLFLLLFLPSYSTNRHIHIHTGMYMRKLSPTAFGR